MGCGELRGERGAIGLRLRKLGGVRRARGLPLLHGRERRIERGTRGPQRGRVLGELLGLHAVFGARLGELAGFDLHRKREAGDHDADRDRDDPLEVHVAGFAAPRRRRTRLHTMRRPRPLSA